MRKNISALAHAQTGPFYRVPLAAETVITALSRAYFGSAAAPLISASAAASVITALEIAFSLQPVNCFLAFSICQGAKESDEAS